MKKNILTLIISFCTLIAFAQTPGKPMVKPANVMKDVMAFLVYRRDYLRLSEDFKAYDAKQHAISKKEFLKMLATGNYLPLRLTSPAADWAYQLYPLKPDVNTDTRMTIRQAGEEYYAHYLQEGKKMPAFKFIDLKGNIYTNANTKGKIIVLKAWFINCTNCVKEMPELNLLTERYKSRKDIIFVSMAFDSKNALVDFQKKKAFKYAVVPVKKEYMEQILAVDAYPTHWLINKQGTIIKRANDPNEMIAALDKEAIK